MDWEEALEIVMDRTRHEPFRSGCAEDHPDRETWRARMIEMATNSPPAPASYPPVYAMAGTALAAAGRAAAAAVHGRSATVPAAEYDRRLATCRACPEFDAIPARCRLCGCYASLKLRLAAERCPLEPPKWGPFTAPS